jgi:hypothetical protein
MTYLQPIEESIPFKGKICYNESAKAWNVIRLNKMMLEIFRDLRQRRKSFYYEMTLFYRYEQLEKSLRKMQKDGEKPPMLLRIKERNTHEII